MDLQLPFNSSNQQVPKVDPTLRWSMSWTSSSTCPWLHSSGGFASSEKTWMTKLTWMNFKDLGKIIGPSHSLIMSFEFLFFSVYSSQKLPLFFSQLQDSFSIPFLEALPAAVWNALDPWRRFPRRASRNFAAVTSDWNCWQLSHNKAPQNPQEKTEMLQTFQLEPTSALELHSLKQTASLGDEASLLGKHYL